MKRGPDYDTDSGFDTKRSKTSLFAGDFKYIKNLLFKEKHPAETPPIDGSSPISALPLDVLALILNEASADQALSPALRAVNRSFRRGYSRALKNQININEAALKKQQKEIKYLFKNKEAILEKEAEQRPVVTRYFEKLEASNKKRAMDDEIAFQVREEILNQLNEAIVRREINPGFKDFLSCYDCHLTRFPGTLITDPTLKDYWSKLEGLDLEKNRLTAVPAEIGQLEALKKLSLRNNYLTDVPGEIGQLRALWELEIGDNLLTAVPAEIGQLEALGDLWLYDNLITAVPAAIGRLVKLQTLDLSDNQLIALPTEIGQLSNLGYLYLSSNELSAVPAEIGRLVKLYELHLENNQLTAVPAEVGQLEELKWLWLNNNQLTELPDNLRKELRDNDNSIITKAKMMATQTPPQAERKPSP